MVLATTLAATPMPTVTFKGVSVGLTTLTATTVPSLDVCAEMSPHWFGMVEKLTARGRKVSDIMACTYPGGCSLEGTEVRVERDGAGGEIEPC